MTDHAHGTAADYWEERYSAGTNWSGAPNAALVREIEGVEPGAALDLGSGEGGDALWLARNGWSVTAVDIAPSALAVGAAAQQPDDDITWVAADLADWQPPRNYDLVSACFLHSTVGLPRDRVLRRVADAVAPGGLFLIVGHSGTPHWTPPENDGYHHEQVELPDPDEMLATLVVEGLNQDDWTVVTSALIDRPTVAPDGSASVITDSVLKLQRAS